MPPVGFDGHQLTREQIDDIEQDADCLCGALLCPKDVFQARFVHHRSDLEPLGGDRDRMIKKVVDLVAKEFRVSTWHAARRAFHLGYLQPDEYKRNYVDNIPM